MSLLGIDIGTSGCRAVAFAEDGTPLAGAGRRYPTQRPSAGRAEQDAEAIWDAVAACVVEVNGAVGANPVSALAVAAQGETIVALDRHGAPLAPAPLSYDLRASEQAAALARLVGAERVRRVTGQPAHPMYSVAKLAWWRAHEPDLWARAARFVCLGEWVALRLGVEPAIDYTMAARTGALDLAARAWSAEVLGALGVDAARLSPPVPCGTALGHVERETARTLGFTEAVTVVAGAHDQAASMWGAGAVRPDLASFSLGTSECLTVLHDGVGVLPETPFPFYPHDAGSEHVVLAGNPAGGALLEWFEAEFGGDLDELDVADDAGSVLMLPYVAGSGTAQEDPRATGSIVGLTLQTTRGMVLRALLESSGFELAANLKRLAAAGIPAADVLVVGGGARSDAALQVRADAAGRPLTAPAVASATCRGAALLAGVGAAVYPDLAAAPAPAGTPRTFLPRERESTARRRAAYERLYPALRVLWDQDTNGGRPR